MKRHFGIPIGGTPAIQLGKKLSSGGISPVGPPIVLSNLWTNTYAAGAEFDSKTGTNARSLQDNTNTFIGVNGHTDWVQLVYQTQGGASSGYARFRGVAHPYSTCYR